MDLNAVIEGCKRGEAKARSALYVLYRGRMFAICLHYFSDEEMAKDLLHDAFVVIFCSINALRSAESLEAWMGAIVRNLACDFLYKEKYFLNPSEVPEISEIPEDSISENAPTYDELLDLIDDMPRQYGKVFKLYVLEGLSQKEIAAKLGIKEKTASSDLYKARRFLQNLIRKLYPALILLLIGIPVALYYLQKSATEQTPSISHAAIPVHSDARASEVVDEAIPLDIHPSETLITNRLLSENVSDKDKESDECPSCLPIKDSTVIESLTDNEIQGIEAWKNPTAFAPESAGIDKRKKRILLALHYDGISRVSLTDSPDGTLVTPLQTWQNLTYRSASPSRDIIFDKSWSDIINKINAKLEKGEFTEELESLSQIVEVNAKNSKEVKRSKKHYQTPVSAGLLLSLDCGSAWSVYTGVNYSYRTSYNTIGISSAYLKNWEKVHYIGIPVGLSREVWTSGSFGISPVASLMLDIPVYGISDIEHVLGGVLTFKDSESFNAPFLFSAGAGATLQYRLTTRISIYAEPQVRYTLPIWRKSSSICDPYFNFGLSVGVKLSM